MNAFAGRLTHVLILVSLAAVATHPVHAAQVLEVKDADTAIVRISLRDATRIRVLDGRITDAFGDLFDPSLNPGGRLSLTKDEADGELYVKLVSSGLPEPASPPMPGTSGSLPSAAGAASALTASPLPVKLDIKSDRGSVALLLQPADVIGETLSLHIVGAPERPTREAASGFVDKATSHERVLKALTLAMANPGLADAVAVRDLPAGPREVALWKEARFVLKRIYEAEGLVGEAYELTNVSGQRMVIDERELYRSGVVSIAVRRLELEPGETTPVWIVRQPGH